MERASFISVLTTARHLFLFWASLIQPTTFNPIILRYIFILLSNLCLGLPSCLLLLGFSIKTLKEFIFSTIARGNFIGCSQYTANLFIYVYIY